MAALAAFRPLGSGAFDDWSFGPGRPKPIHAGDAAMSGGKPIPVDGQRPVLGGKTEMAWDSGTCSSLCSSRPLDRARLSFRSGCDLAFGSRNDRRPF